MIEQASPLKIRYSHAPHRTLSSHIIYLWPCVLPATVLNNDTSLVDPDTGAPLDSVRHQYSFQGLCYVRVKRALSDGWHYLADVAATPDRGADTKEVVLTEEDLTFALPCDVRLEHMDPAQILRLMRAHACELAPHKPHTKSVPAETPPPAPSVALCADQDEAKKPSSIEVTENDIPEEFCQGNPAVQTADEMPTAGAHSYMHITPVAPNVLQQVLLRTVRKALQRQLAQTHSRARALELKARYALVARVQDWQRRTRQRVVYVEECRWCVMRQCWVWHLVLEIPESLMAGPAAHAAAA